MSVEAWTFVMVASSFALYIGVALWARAQTTGDFYIAGGQRASGGQWYGYRS